MRPDDINKIVEYIKEQTDHKGVIFININKNAIPIEWIRSQKVDYQNNCLPFDYCRGMQDGYNCCIDYLIDKWEEENENCI